MIDERISLLPNDDGPEWVGNVRLDDSSEAEIRFSVARANPPPDESMRGIREKTPNYIGSFINAYLGLQKKCCLVRPEWKSFDPTGATGGNVCRQRQELNGTCFYLIEGAWDDLLNDERVLSASFESLALETLLVDESIKHLEDDRFTSFFEFDVDNVLSATCTFNATKSWSTQGRSLTRKPKMNLVFKKPQNALNVIHACFYLQDALSLVCGVKFQPLPVYLSEVNRERLPPHKVHIGGQHWTLSRHSLDGLCALSAVRVGQTIQNLIEGMPDLSDDILTYLDLIRSSSNSEDIIFWGMPPLERNVQQLYRDELEVLYLGEEKAFWSFIDERGDDSIKQFAKRHLKVVDRKPPSPRTLIQRAISEFENEGVRFPDGAAENIWSSRAKLTHGSANSLDSYGLSEAADVARTLGILILLKKSGLRGDEYGPGIRVISACCSSALPERR